jgi:hypothetical protein
VVGYITYMINYSIPNSVSEFQAKTPVNGWDGLKSFDDLSFEGHAGFALGKARQARLKFGSRDQFEISVVQNMGDGTGLYGHEKDGDYEVAMWYDGRETMLPLSIGDDVLAGQFPVDITRLMHQAHLNDFAWVTLLHNIRDESRKELGLDI